MVTGDAWYSALENLKFLKNRELGIFMGIAKNRKVSIEPGKYVQVQELEIPDDGIVVHLKKFVRVKVFRKNFKNVQRKVLHHISKRREGTDRNNQTGIQGITFSSLGQRMLS